MASASGWRAAREKGRVADAGRFECLTLCLFRMEPYLFIGKVSSKMNRNWIWDGWKVARRSWKQGKTVVCLWADCEGRLAQDWNEAMVTEARFGKNVFGFGEDNGGGENCFGSFG